MGGFFLAKKGPAQSVEETEKTYRDSLRVFEKKGLRLNEKIVTPDFFFCTYHKYAFSVENVVRFFLLFLYSLNDSLAKVRSYVFCSNMVEVSHVFENYRIEEALDRILKGKGLDLMMASTDYGQAFADFKEKWLEKVTNKTTIMILGDARNNFGKPRTEILKLIQERSKRIVWLNPEPKSFWGTGDSEMKRYLPYCFLAKECSTVNHIKRVVDYMLRTQN